MQKRILIAVDGSAHAKNALMYAAGFASPAADLYYALFHVQPIISQYFLDEAKTDPKIEEALKNVTDENTLASQEMLQKSKELLIGAGIHETNIVCVSQTRMLGLTRDIIEYGRKHRFDTIVAGRRGLSRLQKVFMGSTSAKLIEHSGPIPVWIVDGEVRPRRVLVAVDVQDPSSAVLDHIALMFAGITSVHLTFYHVLQNLRLGEIAPFTPGIAEIEQTIELHEKQTIADYWAATTQRLRSAGFKEEQLSIRAVRRTTKTAKMIIEEAEQNEFDTVIIGRTGSDKAFYFGNVARYVSERLTGRALWIIG